MARDIMAELAGLLREIFDDEDLEVTRETVASDIPGWDSLSNTLVMVSVEDHFSVRFGQNKFANVGDLADKIAELSGQQ